MEQKERDAYDALYEQQHLQWAREDKEQAEILRQQIAKLPQVEESKLEARVDKRDLGANIESKARKQAEEAEMEQKERDTYDALYEQRHLQRAREDKERAEILRQQIAKLPQVKFSKLEARIDKRDEESRDLGADIASKVRKQVEEADLERQLKNDQDKVNLEGKEVNRPKIIMNVRSGCRPRSSS